MKNLLLLISFMFVIALSSCWEDGTILMMYNRTNEELTVVKGYKDERNDTIIIINQSGDLSPIMSSEIYVAPTDRYIMGELGGYGFQKTYCDNYIQREYHGLLHMFIVRTSDVEKYGWKEIVDKNMVLQRYDLTDKDLEMIHRLLYFPPTPAMANISMWPPYGTYKYNFPDSDIPNE